MTGLVMAPVVVLVWAVRAFAPADDALERFELAAGDPNRVASQAALFFLIQVLFVPAALAFVALVRHRGRTLTEVGAGLFALGALGHAAVAGAELMVHQMASSASPEMAQAFQRYEQSGWLLVVVGPAMLGLVLGTLLIAVGVLRSESVPWWIGGALLGFLVVEFGLQSVTDHASTIGAVLLAVAFWGAAWLWGRWEQRIELGPIRGGAAVDESVSSN